MLADRRDRRLPDVEPAVVCARRFAYARPFAAAFVRWALDRGWRVAIWTSATRANASRLVGALLDRADVERLAFLWAQEECALSHWDRGRPKFRKDVARLFVGAGADPRRTVVVDDDEDKIGCANGLHPPRFDAALERNDAALAEGSALRALLEEAFAADDCRIVLQAAGAVKTTR